RGAKGTRERPAGPPAARVVRRPAGAQVRPAGGGVARSGRAAAGGPRLMTGARSMWQLLTFRNLGVIDSAELELSSGCTVITGETGAGKTMVVTALGLLRGDRADLGLVRQGTDQARVEASIE